MPIPYISILFDIIDHEKEEKEANSSAQQSNNKRKLSNDRDLSDHEDQDGDVPTNDLYRKRQQRKIR